MDGSPLDKFIYMGRIKIPYFIFPVHLGHYSEYRDPFHFNVQVGVFDEMG